MKLDVHVPAAAMRAQLEQFGWHLLTNYVVRNADCHAKNIAARNEPRCGVRRAR